MMLQIGAYQFEVGTAAYQSLQHEVSWRWPEQERIGRRPATQYVGPGAETLSLDGIIHPHFRGGLGQVAAMRAEADKGEPLRMVDGLGNVLGLWCIERIDETKEVFTRDGLPLKVRFRLALKRYGEDQA